MVSSGKGSTFVEINPIMKKGSKEMLRTILSQQELIMKALNIPVPAKPATKASNSGAKTAESKSAQPARASNGKFAAKPARPSGGKTVKPSNKPAAKAAKPGSKAKK